MVVPGLVALRTLATLLASSAQAQELYPAIFSTSNGAVRFWQTNHLSGGQGGACIVEFGFDGGDLREPLERLTLTIRVVTRLGADLGLALLSPAEPLGGIHADRYREGTFAGPSKWPHQEDGEPSPLCDEGVTLLVETARGQQGGRVVDLVRFRQLRFTTFPRLTVRVKQ